MPLKKRQKISTTMSTAKGTRLMAKGMRQLCLGKKVGGGGKYIKGN